MTEGSPIRLLIIEDNPAYARLLPELLQRADRNRYEITVHPSLISALEQLRSDPPDIILCDPGVSGTEGLDAVRRTHAAAPHVPLVLLTGKNDETLALQALREGAQDYLIKSELDPRRLERALRFAMARQSTEEAVFVDKERAETTLRSIGDAVVSADAAGNVRFINRAGEALLGWSLEEAITLPITEVVRIVDAATRAGFQAFAEGEAHSADGTQLNSRFMLIRRDRREIPIEGSLAPIRDRDGRVAGEVLVFRDVSVVRATTQQLAHSAQHDFLTGLPNRVLLNDRISAAISIAPRHHKKVAVLFLDLDGFKQINDTMGHAVGDKLLQSVARRLMTCVRGSDTVSRQGGDEFVVLLSEVERPEDAAITARRMLEAVADPHLIEQNELHLTTSVGISIYPDDGTEAEVLIKNADTAMYQAKDKGRHGFQFFKPAMNLRMVERQDIEDGLRRALERNELSLHYQPKVDLRSGRVCGAEALLRWVHPTRGSISPSLFLPVAESSGLIQSIGGWVLRQACTQTKAWQTAGFDLPRIAVNISAMQFHSVHFLDGVFDTMNDTGLDPRALELELTETALLKHAETTDSTLRALDATGVHLSVDDFGTGYSSLSFLRRYPIHTLKIDQSFVREISVAEEQESSVVTAVLNMAKSLKLRVVAEGVETPEELAFLQYHRCDEAQGYFFSPPLPVDDFTRLLRDGLLPTMAARRYQKPRDQRATQWTPLLGVGEPNRRSA